MRVLCVAEKPSIAKSITEILSGGQSNTRNSQHKFIKNYDFYYSFPTANGRRDTRFTVTSVLGHLTSSDFDDRYRKWNSCEPFDLFEAPIRHYVSPDLKKVEQNLIRESQTADMLMIWTDCDREGEHIGSEVADACRKGNDAIVVKRARFSAIIPAQIKRACDSPGELDLKQADAVNARISLDLRIGAAFTRLMTMTLQRDVPQLSQELLSYGPCQFPTLGFVVDQYERVKNFVPEPFWYIYVSQSRAPEVGGAGGDVVFNWKRHHLFDFPAAVVLYERCVDSPVATVTSVQVKPVQKWKPLPLTTVDLQKSGSRLLGFTPKKVLEIAEKLYQQGFLSYPRTETDQFDRDFEFQPLIQKQTVDGAWGRFAQGLIDGGFERPRNGQKNDKAHPPIHPTAHCNPSNPDERRVYEFVTRRFLGCCSRNGVGKTTTVEIDLAEERFHTSGLVISERNYLEVYTYDRWSDSVVPDFDVGETFTPDVCELRDGQTTAPKLLTEADLVGLMDKNGIGTDATIAEHIAKIIDRSYVTEQREGRTKYLIPSNLGIGLVEGYNQIGFERSLSKPHLRRETEHRMQLICDGVQTKQAVLEESIQQYQDVFVRAKREFATMTATVQRYLNENRNPGAVGAPPRRANRRAPDADDGSNGSDDDGYDDDHGGRPAANTRGRGRGASTTRGRGAAPERGRGAARAQAAPRARAERPLRVEPNHATIDDGFQVPLCGCGEPAVERTVAKQTANQGKKFFACGKGEGGCGHFEWASAGNQAPNAGPSRKRDKADTTENRPVKRVRRGPAKNPDTDTKRCNCDLEAPSRTVSKDGPNKGRTFYTCPKPQEDRCGFFEWADEQAGQSFQSRGPQARGPAANALGPPRTDGCFKCGEPGHWSNECPNEGGQSRTDAHRAPQRNAADESRYGGAQGGGSGGGKCFKCDEEGHWSRDCPNDGGGSRNDQRQNYGNRAAPSGGGGAGGCFKCGEEGHWSSACPNDDAEPSWGAKNNSRGRKTPTATRGRGSRGGRR